METACCFGPLTEGAFLVVPLRHIREYLPCAEQSVIIIHLKMAMVPVRIAGVAYIPDDLPLRDGIAHMHRLGRHVRVQRLVPVAVVDLHVVAPAPMAGIPP